MLVARPTQSRGDTLLEEINVHVVDYGRNSLYMRYTDPVTGKHVTRSTGTKRKREAERAAAKWEAELREGRSRSKSRMTWIEFRERVDTIYLPGLAKKSANMVWTSLDSFESFARPHLMGSITSDLVARWQQALRSRRLAEATIRSYSATLKAVLRWAVTIELIPAAPSISMPKRARSSDRQTPMKGRALTDEEFGRMIGCIETVVGPTAAPSWTRLIEGLWLSGLRLSEALSLTWDDENELRVDVSDENYIMLAIPAERQKNHRDELLPIAPEFRVFLLECPRETRSGHVFPLVWRRRPRSGDGRRVDTVGKVITAVGRAAGLVVSEKNGKTKYASAHDLRRSFGDRWASRVQSLTLKTLMRHGSIETTERYYVTRNARTVIDELNVQMPDLG